MNKLVTQELDRTMATVRSAMTNAEAAQFSLRKVKARAGSAGAEAATDEAIEDLKQAEKLLSAALRKMGLVKQSAQD